MSHVDLDIAPPKRWRGLLPGWLRSLIWVDAASRYDGFLSYSLKSDRSVAPVIQSVIHHFLCPWYKPRAKTVFRDLSSLPASSSLETELLDRLDRSTHLLVLASPGASESRGMEMEARHWLSRPRAGQILIILTEGSAFAWDDVRTTLLPPALRDGLVSEPLWASVRDSRAEIIANPSSDKLREKITEDIQQILLRFYPGMDWGQLRGEERALRRRAIRLVSFFMFLFLFLSFAATAFGIYALLEQRLAESRQNAAQSQLVAGYDPVSALSLGIKAARRAPTEEAQIALGGVLEAPLVRLVLNHSGAINDIAFSPRERLAATASDDKTVQIWDVERGIPKRTLQGYKDGVLTVSFSADGRRIVAGDKAGMVKAWDLDQEEPLFTHARAPDPNADPERHNVRKVFFSPDGTRILAVYDDALADMWEASGNPVRSWQICDDDFYGNAVFSPDSRLLIAWGSQCAVANVLDGHTAKPLDLIGWPLTMAEAKDQQGSAAVRSVSEIVLSPDGKSVLLREYPPHTSLWKSRGAKGKPIKELGENLATSVERAAFSPDGRSLVTANSDHSLWLWTVPDYQPAYSATGHTGSILDISFAAQGKLLVTRSSDNSVRFWSADRLEPLLVVGGGPAALGAAAVSPDGKLIVTTDGERTAQVWGTEKTHPRMSLHLEKPIRQAMFIGSSHVLVCQQDEHCDIWDGATTHLLATPDDPAEAALAATSPDGQRIAFIAHKDAKVDQIEAYNTLDREPHAKVPNIDCGRGPIFSKDLMRMICIASGRKTATLVELKAKPESKPLEGHSAEINSASFSDDGTCIVTTSDDRTALIWDAGSGLPLARLPHAHEVRGADFTPDGKTVLTTDGQQSVWRWDWAREVAHPVNGTFGEATFLFSPDSKHGLIVTDEGSERNAALLDLGTGKVVGSSIEVTRAAWDHRAVTDFNLDGKHLLIASQEHTPYLINTGDGSLQARLVGHSGKFQAAAFSLDGRHVATASDDGTVKIWEVESGRLSITFKPGESVDSVSYSPDGKWLLAVTEHDIYVYPADLAGLLSLAECLAPAQVGQGRPSRPQLDQCASHL